MYLEALWVYVSSVKLAPIFHGRTDIYVLLGILVGERNNISVY